jgi:hypothetical protein
LRRLGANPTTSKFTTYVQRQSLRRLDSFYNVGENIFALKTHQATRGVVTLDRRIGSSYPVEIIFHFLHWPSVQGCQIFLGATYQNGKIYQMTINYTKQPQNILKGLKIDQMAINYTNIFH